MKTKICTKCKKRKSLFKFHKNKRAADGVRSQCKDCHNKEGKIYKRKWYKENPDKAKCQNLRSKYGITLQDYNKMFAEQNGVCAICGQHQPERTLCVEHRHSDGKIRGLVCKTCNHLIDIYETDFYGLKEEVIKYMEKHND